MVTVFNLSKTASRKRIRDRGILWKEKYHDRSGPLKKRFDKDIGPGAYYRWEGHDYSTDGDYFIVVGPAIERSGQKSFFSGIKRLPPRYRYGKEKSYAPSGEYFTNIISALSHSAKMWGITFPKNQTKYDRSDLDRVEIPRHIKG